MDDFGFSDDMFDTSAEEQRLVERLARIELARAIAIKTYTAKIESPFVSHHRMMYHLY